MGQQPAPNPCPDFIPDLYDDEPTTDHLNDDFLLLNCRDYLEHCLDLDPAYYKPRRRITPDLDS
jgi:hypothetical protein